MSRQFLFCADTDTAQLYGLARNYRDYGAISRVYSAFPGNTAQFHANCAVFFIIAPYLRLLSFAAE
ncbi:hypothetical protein B1B05_04240 [Domibacillus enclensis]|uniref:Uncharacterized protein n=1 Tax=Domibacillus enclensis TaxID=1017273 RepID=A0ABX4EAF1_9BACI|nr:hypothetical protein B1B05_04240 [Domibacillus enclensis]